MLSVAEVFQQFINKKITEEICTELHKKVKAVFSSSRDRHDRKLEGHYTPITAHIHIQEF
jgi:hypothetical protein